MKFNNLSIYQCPVCVCYREKLKIENLPATSRHCRKGNPTAIVLMRGVRMGAPVRSAVFLLGNNKSKPSSRIGRRSVLWCGEFEY